MLCQFHNGNTAQSMISASCPIDLMSHDNFISIFSVYRFLLTMEIFNPARLKIPTIKDLDERIGDSDILTIIYEPKLEANSDNNQSWKR